MLRKTRFILVALVVVGLVAAPHVAYAAVRISKIHFDPPGEDSPPEPNSDLNKERVVICNLSRNRRNMSRWKLVDRGPDHRYTFPHAFSLRAEHCITVHTGSGKDGSHNLFMDLDFYVWNNDGDRATLKTRTGDVRDRCSYSGGSSPADC